MKKYKLIAVLLLAMVCIWISQAMPLLYGPSSRAFAGHLLFLMVGSFTFLFFDLMLQNKGKMVFNMAWGLMFPNWIVYEFWNVSLIFWITALMYTVYFFCILIAVLTRNTKQKQEKPHAGIL
jgi:hypothetical protein